MTGLALFYLIAFALMIIAIVRTGFQAYWQQMAKTIPHTIPRFAFIIGSTPTFVAFILYLLYHTHHSLKPWNDDHYLLYFLSVTVPGLLLGIMLCTLIPQWRILHKTGLYVCALIGVGIGSNMLAYTPYTILFPYHITTQQSHQLITQQINGTNKQILSISPLNPLLYSQARVYTLDQSVSPPRRTYLHPRINVYPIIGGTAVIEDFRCDTPPSIDGTSYCLLEPGYHQLFIDHTIGTKPGRFYIRRPIKTLATVTTGVDVPPLKTPTGINQQ